MQKLAAKLERTDHPSFGPGNTVRVQVKIREGEKERLQAFEGMVIATNKGPQGTFTVRKMSFGQGVERIFPYNSKVVDKVEKVRSYQVRRSKLFYLRGLRGKAARLHRGQHAPHRRSSLASLSKPKEACREARVEAYSRQEEDHARVPASLGDPLQEDPAASTAKAARAKPAFCENQRRKAAHREPASRTSVSPTGAKARAIAAVRNPSRAKPSPAGPPTHSRRSASPPFSTRSKKSYPHAVCALNHRNACRSFLLSDYPFGPVHRRPR